jgi:hypothetical protein
VCDGASVPIHVPDKLSLRESITKRTNKQMNKPTIDGQVKDYLKSEMQTIVLQKPFIDEPFDGRLSQANKRFHQQFIPFFLCTMS